jgi:D-alanyl-D-alanine carboxypeptidase/D-alanyl-D-alanine-endopeptidase (penicillin-binding protein 4)
MAVDVTIAGEDGRELDMGTGFDDMTELSHPALERQMLAAVLRAAQYSPWAPEFLSSLPIVAVDGTMKRRLKDSPAAARARIKTGTLHNGVAVAGYVPDANGEQCIVVALVNHENANDGKGRAVVDALIDWVAHSSAGAGM